MAAVLFVAAIVFIVRFIGPQTVGDQVKRHVHRILSEQYPDLQVSIGHGRFEPNIGLILEDIRFGIRPDRTAAAPAVEQAIRKLGLSDGPSRELLRIDRVVVFAKAELGKLANRENPLVTKRVLISGVRAHAWVERSNEISLARLWPPPKFGDSVCPRLEIRDAQLAFHPEDETARPIQVDVSEAVLLKQATSQASDGSSAVSCSMDCQAIGSSSLVDGFSLQLSMLGNRGKLSCDLSGARISGDLLEQIPRQYRDRLNGLRGLRILTDTKVTATFADGKLSSLQAHNQIHDGTFQHPASVMPVQRIRGLVIGRTNSKRAKPSSI